MRIAIVGAGAMGSLFGGRLAKAGVDVTLVDVNKAHIDAINARGLSLDSGDGPRRIDVKATTEPASAGVVDLIVIFCKYRQTAEAMNGARPMMSPETYVWTLQNGIGNVELIRETVAEDRVVKGLTTATGIYDGPGVISTNFKGETETFLWPLDGGAHPLLDDVAAAFTGAGLPTYRAPDIDYRIWRKLVINAGLTVISAAVNVGIGEVGESEAGQQLLGAVIEEVVAVAQAAGVPLQLEDARAYLEELRHKAFNHIGSTTIDLQGGRLTEIDAMCGAVVREGARLGVPTPTNLVITRMVKLIEATRETRLTPAI